MAHMHTKKFLVHVSVAVWLAAVALPVRAEMDYEFAKMLMDDSNPSFETDDLVEHLVAQLEGSQVPGIKTEAKLIKATLMRRQSKSASLDKSKRLLNDSDALFKEVAAEKGYRLQSVAEKELGTLNSEIAFKTIKNAQELEKTDPIAGRKMRDEAVAAVGKIADGYKAEADALRLKFEEVYKKYKIWQDKENHGGTGDKPIPKDMLDKLMSTFNPWLAADLRYVSTKVEQVECYSDNDPNKKKTGEELAKLCETRANQDDITEFAVIVARYNYWRGRAWAAIQNEKNAGDAWKEALDQPDSDMAPEQKKVMFTIKKMILHDLIKMKMHAKDYSGVENVIVETKVTDLRSIFDEDAGKELIIDYAKALTLPAEATAAEYEKAVKELRTALEKEGKGGAVTKWSNDFSRSIAEILEELRTSKPFLRPKLSAQEWYDAAHGLFLMGQIEYLKYQDFEKDRSPKAQAQFEKCYTEYQNAVDYYRRAVATARGEKTDLPMRVEVEPKAWFEMGLCYIKMRHYYEAIIVYQAMRDRYMPEGRKKWLPNLADPRVVKPNIAKTIQDTLADLDKSKEQDGLLAKSGSNIAFSLDANLKAHSNPKDGWNPRLKEKIMGGDVTLVDDSNIKDLKYTAGRNDMDEAGRLSKAGTEALKGKPPDPKLAEENYTLSAAKYTSAGDKFVKVETASDAYELALYQAGTAYTMAQALWVTGKLPSKIKVAAEAAKDLGVKALGAFDKYDALIAKGTGSAEDKKRRQNLAGMVLLARNALYSGSGQWENVIKSADQYMQWEQQNPQPSTSVNVALMNKFRGQIELAAANIAPKCDPFLQGAEESMKAWHKIKEKDNKTYVFMLEALARRFNIASFQVEKFIKEGKAEYTAPMLEGYENKVADLWSERVEMVEEAEGGEQQTSLEDYARVVYLFNKSHRDRKVADCAKRLLEKFDPKGACCKIGDGDEEGKVWQALLAKMQAVIKYNDLAKWDRCKRDHMTLVDYMYDTREGIANADHPEKRPVFDKYNVDMEKARKQWETIKNNYPDCQTFKAEYGENGKSFMDIIWDEIDFRRKIEAARDLLFNKSIALADQFDKDKDADSAKKYREIADAQLQILIKLRGDTPDTLLLSGRLAYAIGKYDDAHDKVNQIKIQVPEDHPTYFDACRLDSEVYKAQKKWKDAAEYPQFYALTIGFDAKRIKDRWPDMKEFLEECYANGVPRPAQGVKAPAPPKKGEATPPEGKKEEAKKDEAKKDEAKKDEAKKDEAKKDEAKKDEAKPEEKKAPTEEAKPETKPEAKAPAAEEKK
ncbi:MAG: hypothetical protein ABSE73_05735 [Planctomycetota bacterium]